MRTDGRRPSQAAYQRIVELFDSSTEQLLGYFPTLNQGLSLEAPQDQGARPTTLSTTCKAARPRGSTIFHLLRSLTFRSQSPECSKSFVLILFESRTAQQVDPVLVSFFAYFDFSLSDHGVRSGQIRCRHNLVHVVVLFSWVQLHSSSLVTSRS